MFTMSNMTGFGGRASKPVVRAGLWACGANNYGQLGLGDTISPRTTPVQVGGATAANWTQVACGFHYTLAIRADGTLWAWGNNNNVQLGLGDSAQRTAPVQVGTGTNWVRVATNCDGMHTIALKTDGTLWAWGQNTYGQLGLGDIINSRTTPIQVGTATNWIQVAGGSSHALAIRSDGTLWAWGYNVQGQLGLGDTTNRTTPVQVGTATNWIQVAGGSSHTLARRSDGTLWAWGNNGQGQLGLGDTTQRNAPVQVGTATNWTQVAGGAYHTVAISSDGTLWAWGYNVQGQLGLGDTTQRNAPVRVGTATNWAHVICGSHYIMAVRSDGTLWAWGYNVQSQLGLGDTTQRTTPVQVGTATNWIQVAGGNNHTMAIAV